MAALGASTSSSTLGFSSRSGFEIQCEDDEPGADDSTPDVSPAPRLAEEGKDLSLCLRMYRAALKGDWKAAGEIIEKEESIVRWQISLGSYTALHVAVGAGQVQFVEKLVKEMKREDLRLQDEKSNTAFCVAAAAGSLETAKIMTRKDPEQPRLLGYEGRPPLYFAALFGRQKMAACLYSPSESDKAEDELFFTCIKSGLYGLASVMLKKKPLLARGRDKDGLTALHLLATKPSAFTSKSTQSKLCRSLAKCFTSTILKISAELASELDKNNHKVHTVLDLLAGQSCCASVVPETSRGLRKWFPSPFGRLWKKLKRYLVLKVLETHPELLLHLEGSNIGVALTNLSNQEDATGVFRELLDQSESSAHALVKDIWDEVMKLDHSEYKDILASPTHLLFDAAESGNSKFVAQLIHDFPDLIWETNDKNWSIIHAAVNNRNERIFSLVYEIGLIKDVITSFREKESGCTLLHLAANLAPASQLNKLPGPAFQMQRELLWFEEVKKIMRPSHIEMKNSVDGMTPQDLFSKQHEDLLKAGQEWMNGTARSCTLVSTLIASALFAAIISVSLAGNHPLKTAPFRFFIISDAIACLLALMSTTTFLAILTSPYAERDFLIDLPSKLKTGLAFLLVSIIPMMGAFSSAIFIGYGWNDLVTILVAVLALLTVIVTVVQQWQLLSIAFGSVSSADSLFKVSDIVLL